MRISKLVVIMVTAVAFAWGCGGALTYGTDPSSTGDNTGDNGGNEEVIYSAPANVAQDDSSRSGITFDLPGECETLDCDWWVSIDGGDFVQFVPNCVGGDCSYELGCLDVNQTYSVVVRYGTDDGLSENANVSVTVEFKHLVAYGGVAESNYGWSLDVGDINADGYADILVAHRPGVAGTDGQVDLYLGQENPSSLTPYVSFISTNTTTRMHGVEVHLADVTGPNGFGVCDGLDDILIGESRDDAGNNGYVWIMDGAKVAAGDFDAVPVTPNTYRSDQEREIRLRGDADTSFGEAFDTYDNGAGCRNILVGAPDTAFQAGEVFNIPNTSLFEEPDINSGDPAFSIYTGGPLAEAGRYVADAGYPDGGNVGKGIFMGNMVAGPPDPPNEVVSIRFSDYAAAAPDWATITYFRGDVADLFMGSLDGSAFYISGGTADGVGGGFANLYTSRANNVPTNIIENDTISGFGSSMAVVDDMLIVGSMWKGLVVYNYPGLGAEFSVVPVTTLSQFRNSGNMHIGDYNGDTCEDFIGWELNGDDPGGGSNVGAVHVYY